MKKLEKYCDYSFYYIEKLGPTFLFLCFLIVGVIVQKQYRFDYNNNLINLVDSIITFSAIIVGFVGVLLAVLFSIRNTEIISLLFERKEKKVLKGYFTSTILSGLFLVVISSLLFLKDYIDSVITADMLGLNFSNWIFAFWLALIAFLFGATYRIINIMMHIVFSDGSIQNKELEGIELEETKKRDLKSRLKK